MITADQLVLHLIGDYLLQSDKMALNKTRSHLWAFVHALTYSLLFATQVHSLTAWLVIFGSHFLIDRYRLSRYIVWAKNWPATPPWSECTATGYPPDRPVWMVVWLMIIADNILHIVINGLAVRYL